MKKILLMLPLILILLLCGFQTENLRYTRAEIITIGCGGTENGVLTDDPATLKQLQTMVDSFQTKVIKGDSDVPDGGTAVVIKLETNLGRIQTLVFIAGGRWVNLDGENYACKQSDYRAALEMAKNAPAQKELAYWMHLDKNRSELSAGFLSAPGAAAELRTLIGGLAKSPLKYSPDPGAPDCDPMFQGELFAADFYDDTGFSTYHIYPGAVIKQKANEDFQVLTLTSAQHQQVVKLLGAGPLTIPAAKKLTVSGTDIAETVITNQTHIRAILAPLRGAARAKEQGGGFCGTGAYQLTLESGASYTVYDGNDLWIYDSTTQTLYHNPKDGSHKAWVKTLN